MKEYLMGLILAGLSAALVGILTPEGERGGIGKHMRLLTSLFLICVLIVPLKGAAEGIKAFLSGEWSLSEGNSDTPDYADRVNEALDAASEVYFVQMLAQTLSEEFSISADDLRLTVAWERDGEALRPREVRVILSGRAIWQDPRKIKEFTENLLGCTCITAIES